MVIRDVEVRESDRRKALEEILGVLGMKVFIEGIKKIEEVKEKGSEMLLVRLGNENQKWELIEKKKNLRDRKERISEGLSWKERS